MASYQAIVALLCMLAFSFFGGNNALDECVLETTLYIIQSPAQDQRPLGTDTVIINWPIKDGPGAAANTIGHAEGLTTFANHASGSWVTIMDLVFEGGSLAGSSLQVMGLHGSKNDQWSVMGGTRQLTMARGIINYNITQSTSASRTFEVYIYVYYTSL
ncbi:uncharacterized protein LOC110436291 [Sorghum bicolor]|uniref:Dirigent protein n=1 Tax=Sorghum bicolor TaxID=4558 RepID=A0A1B6PJE0_SORBI|nr:uncharacterized protein LOC110436291 [Sorghum bicolor]KXG25789.1 hypothetical protein SORBI_3006G011900 [Sorghum bicolor]|eukprot:XP_021318630.1 uncharacterized protein LOC110436291 [Sorghum bicolor]